jgi:hypothetical protein
MYQLMMKDERALVSTAPTSTHVQPTADEFGFAFDVDGHRRLTVDLFDLLYLYPDYEVPALLDELRQQMR